MQYVQQHILWIRQHLIGWDLNIPVNGRLTDCSDACTSAPNCLEFSREKSKSDDTIAQCWLKKIYQIRHIMMLQINQTYTKDGTPE